MSPRRVMICLAAVFGLVLAGGTLAVWAFPLQAPASQDSSAVVNSGLRLLHQPPVEYPLKARQKGIQGAVVLELSVDEKGTVADARVLSGPEELRRAALQAVLQWHYATDTSLPARLQVAIEFRLPPGGGQIGERPAVAAATSRLPETPG